MKIRHENKHENGVKHMSIFILYSTKMGIIIILVHHRRFFF